MADGSVEGQAEGALDDRLVREADAEHQVPVAENRLGGECLAGQHRGMAGERRYHGRSELEPGCAVGHRREDGQRLVYTK